VTFSRGAVWLADYPSVGEKRVLVVSPDFLNRALANVVVARVTAVERERALPTFVRLRSGDVPGLPEPSYIITHDLATLPKGVFQRFLGDVPAQRLLEVDDALRVALDL
jgi:mRNA-degrading endonuclease toxin of MazEF toxin-antitoxin module